MPSAPVFGRVDDPDQLKLKPFKITLAGYVDKDGERKEKLYEFTCSGVRPFEAHLGLIRASTTGSQTTLDKLVGYVEAALVDDDEREHFRTTLALPDVYFDGDCLGEVADWLMTHYSDRPTRPRSGSRSSGSNGGQRSSGAGSARAGATSGDSRRGRR